MCTHNRVRYLLTPTGLTEKTRLTYEYLQYSLYLYRRVREVLKQQLQAVRQAGGTTILVFGSGEIAEIAYLTVKELGLDLAAIVDDRRAGSSFFGVPIIGVDEAGGRAFDCGIITVVSEGWEDLQRRVQAAGIPQDKLILIEQHGARIDAADPALVA